MAIAISVSDNHDGQALVTVSGAGVGYVEILAVKITDLTNGWVNVSQGISDGQAVIPLSSTGGWFFVAATDQILTSPVYSIISDDTEQDIWDRCLEAIASQIALLGLADVDPQRIKAQKQPIDSHLAKVLAAAQQPGKTDASPAILVTPIPETKPTRQYSGTRRLDYGCRVSMFVGNDYDPEKWRTKQLLWRKRIGDVFDGKRLTGVTEVEQCIVTPGEVFSLQGFARGYDIQALDIRCRACHRA